jgi:hypothetical protein
MVYPPGWSHDNSKMTTKQLQRQLRMEELRPVAEPRRAVPEEYPG